MTLTEKQFATEVGYSRGSLKNQLLHVANTDSEWLRGLRGQPDARAYHLNPADFPDRVSVKSIWEQTADEMKAYLSTQDQDELERIPPGMRGPVWQVLLHLINHGTDHRAQILRLLAEYGAPTFDQDLIVHLWRRPKQE